MREDSEPVTADPPADAPTDPPATWPLDVEVDHDEVTGVVRVSWRAGGAAGSPAAWDVALGLDGQFVPIAHDGPHPWFDYPSKVFSVSVPLRLPLRVVPVDAAGARGPTFEGVMVLPPLVPLARADEWEVGPPEVVVDDGTRRSLGLEWWADGNIGFAAVDGEVRAFAANGPHVARWTPTAEAFLTDLEPSTAVAGLDPTTRYAAGGPVLVGPDGTLLLVYHGEEHPDGVGGGFWGFLGLARSTDGGRSFRHLGRIVTPNLAVDSDRRLPFTEVGGGPCIVRDGHLLVYFRETLGSGRPLNVSVARAPLDDLWAAAARGEAARFVKYHDGGWTEPGFGGRASELCPEPPGPRWFDVVDLVDHGVAVLVQTDGAGLEWATSIRTSADGVTWSAPRHLCPPESGAELLYLTLTSPDLVSQRQVRGDEVHLYRTRSRHSGGEHRWDDARLERRVLRLRPGRSPAGAPSGRAPRR